MAAVSQTWIMQFYEEKKNVDNINMFRMVKDAKEDLNEAKNELIELLKGEPKLIVRNDDNFMLRHLRASEGNPQTAFQKLKNYYQLKQQHPEWYASGNPLSYKKVLEMGSDVLLENRDKKGRRIWVHKTRLLDASKTTIHELSQVHDLLLEAILDEDETQRNGMVVLCDMKDLNWNIVKWASPANAIISAKKADSLPFPQLEYHVINTSLFVSLILKVAYPFLSAKQKASLFIHGDNLASLHEHIDPSVLPEEYGGLLPNPDLNSAFTMVQKNSEELVVNLGLGYID